MGWGPSEEAPRQAFFIIYDHRRLQATGRRAQVMRYGMHGAELGKRNPVVCGKTFYIGPGSRGVLYTFSVRA